MKCSYDITWLQLALATRKIIILMHTSLLYEVGILDFSSKLQAAEFFMSSRCRFLPERNMLPLKETLLQCDKSTH